MLGYFTSLAIYSCIIYFLYILLKNVIKWIEIIQKIKTMPGLSCRYLLVGNVDYFLQPPDKLFIAIRKAVMVASTFKAWISLMPVIGTYNPDDIEKIMTNTINNSKDFFYDPLHEWLGTGLLTSGGQKWHTRRKILTPSFHFSILHRFLPVFTKETRHLVENLAPECEKESTNVIPFITKFTLNSICETAMGTSLNYETTDRHYIEAVYRMGTFVVHRLSHPWLLLNVIYMATKMYWTQKRTAQILHSFSRKVIEQRKNNLDPTDFDAIIEQDNFSYSEKKRLAMLDMMLYAQKQGADIDDDGIREEVDTFMFEGHDTTATSINFTLMLLACNKECQDKLYEELSTVFGDSDRDPTYQDLQELKYTERCIKESLRLYPSVPLVGRVIGKDIVNEKGNYIIPKDISCKILIYDLHRVAEIYPEPEKFDPDRFLPENIAKRHPYAYIPFSAGPRNCIGQKFALMELKTVISGILRNYILEPVDTPDTLVLVTDIILRTKDDCIKVRFRKRKE